MPLLVLDHDHQITTKNKLMTNHVILTRLPTSHQRRLLGRPWTLTCYGVGVTVVTDFPSASDPSRPLVPDDHPVLLVTMEPRSLPRLPVAQRVDEASRSLYMRSAELTATPTPLEPPRERLESASVAYLRGPCVASSPCWRSTGSRRELDPRCWFCHGNLPGGNRYARHCRSLRRCRT